MARSSQSVEPPQKPGRFIPCFCRVRSSSFEILFQDPFPQATGVVEGWDQRVLDERADAGAGGQYLHYCFGMVTLRKAGEHIFDIVDLSFFKSSIGWCSIVESGKLSPLKQWNPLEDEIEFEASFKNKKLNKKQQETMDALAKAGFVNRPTD